MAGNADQNPDDGRLPLDPLRATNLSESMVGTHFARFDILSVAGRGGMGLVFKARHPESGILLALKVLPVLTRRDREPIRRFLAEAEVLARLDHPNIPKIHTMGREGHLYYIGTEYIKGRTVARIIDGSDAFTTQQALLVVRGVAQGLSAAHRHGILHRDIKSDNLMIDREGLVKVLDFGIAQDLRAKRRITLGDQCLGNPEYCSPEQLSTGEMDARTDIYSLGIVLYEMLVGEVPFHGVPTMEMFQAKKRNRIPALNRMIPNAPRNLARMMKKMVAPKREKRFGNMDELIAAIDEIRPTLGDFGRLQPSNELRARSERRRPSAIQRALANLF